LLKLNGKGRGLPLANSHSRPEAGRC